MIFLITSIFVFGQEKENNHEILEKARFSIYQNPEDAIKLSQQVYESATDADLKIKALMILVNGFTAINKNEEALKYATEALHIAQETKNITNQIRTLGLLGEQYQIYHLNDISRNYLKQAKNLLAVSKLSASKSNLIKGNLFAVIGNGYKDEVDCAYAIENYNMAINLYKKASDKAGAKNNLALVYIEKANCLLELKEYQKAEENFRLGLKISKNNALKEYEEYAILGLSKINTINKDHDEAIQKLESLLVNNHFNDKPLLKMNTYKLLTNNYLENKNINKYHFYKEKYVASKDELNKLETQQFNQVLKFLKQHQVQNKKNFTLEKITVSTLSLFLLSLIYITFLNQKSKK